MDEELRNRIKRKVRAYYGVDADPPTEEEKKVFLNSLKEQRQKGELHGPLEESDTNIDRFQ